jgi:ribosomal protein S18 acetylase RimI-like enzyme
VKIEIRPSRPEDAVAVAPYIYSSGPYSFNCVFASDETVVLPFICDAFSNGVGELQYGNHVTVTKEGAVVGCGAALAPNPSIGQTIGVLRHFLGSFGTIRGIGIVRRGLAFEKIVQPPKGDLWILAHLGVDEQLRGQRIGAQLIHHLIDSVRQRGGQRVGLDVAVINPKAEALYKRLGFQVTDERKSNLSNEFGTVPDFHRMEMSL